MIELKLVKSVEWVPTEEQLSDCMTKSGLKKKSEWLLSVMSSNRLRQ